MEGTCLQLTFQNGVVREYDLSALFRKYPQLEALKNRELFCAGKLTGGYGIIWNEDLDLEAETVYEEGRTVAVFTPDPGALAGEAVMEARARAGWTQKKLAEETGIDQSDISKIERGIANPSVGTLGRIADALQEKLVISIVPGK